MIKPIKPRTRRPRRGDGRCRIDRLAVAAAGAAARPHLDITGSAAPPTLSKKDQAAIEADRQELADLKAMWESQELKTREYRAMRKTVEDRITGVQKKLIVRPAVEVLDGLVGPDARRSWDRLKKAKEYQRMNAVLRFLFSAVIIDASTTRGRAFDFGRVDIDPNPL